MKKELIKTDKVLKQILLLVQGVITAAVAVVVAYGMLTNQF